MQRPGSLAFGAIAAWSVFAFRVSAQPPASAEFFEAKIRPVLATNCYNCHTDTAMGGLRVDSREALFKGGGRGPAIVAGDAEHSVLIGAVRQTDAKLKMPLGGKLKPEEIDALVEWIKAGAPWPEKASAASLSKAAETHSIAAERKKFWSFLPLQDPKPPAVRDPKWALTDIDRFIFAKLEKEGLKPVRPASRHDLIRRAYLDLTGVPPSPDEVEEFEKDKSADGFAKVVDRLLASPRYGERWGRYWLDVARFGEDDYRSLNPNPRGYYIYPNAYLYRDWVIQAVNDDLPYDQFVKAQIAGDLLDPKIRYKTLPATGFLGLGPWYFDNGAVEVTRADERHDRVDVITRGFLGLTVACARCHDHKYDPIPTTDYYSLAGVFADTVYHEYPRAPKTVRDEYTRLQKQLERKQQMLQEMQTNLATQLAETLALRTSDYLQAVFEVKGPLKRDRAAVVEQRKLDYELLDRWLQYMDKPTDKYHRKDAWQAMMKKPAPNVQAAKKLAEEFQAEVIRVMLDRRELKEENEIIADQALPGTKKKKPANKPNEFVTNDDFCPGCGLRLKNMSEEDTSFWTEIFQRELKDSDDIAAMMAMGGRMGNPGVLLFRGWGLETRVGSEARNEIAAMKSDTEALQKKLEPAFPFIHGVADVEKPANLPVSVRGNPYNLGPEIPRHFLSALSEGEPKPFQQGSGRLELAEDIVKQPIAMRVIVNRIWRGHFGTGIVDTPSNFGMTGERPTNPELLEYLASSFVKSGMSMKKLHREIMLSAVYQLSSDRDDANFAKDSGNRFYWQANRKRLDAEQLRDSVLLTAGNLDDSMGGPSGELTPAFTKRTVYGRVSRYKLDQYLQLFDFPTPNISTEKRFTTTVPLQRLFLMNSDFMQVEAEALAKRIAEEPDNRARIRKAYRLIYQRAPSEEEVRLGLDYLHNEPLREYEENRNKPKDGDSPPRKGPDGEGAIPTSVAAKPSPEAVEAAVDGAGGGENPAMGMGMMGGMGRRSQGPGAPPEVKYEPTAWGRYLKILFSSSEFLFVN